MSGLSTIIESWMESEGLQNQAFGKFIDSVEGDNELPDLEPEVDGEGDDEPGNDNGNGGGGNGGQLPNIDIGIGDSVGQGDDIPGGQPGPNPEPEPSPVMAGGIELPPNVAAALLKLKGAISNVDRTVEEEGADIYQVEGWWKKTRELIMHKKFEHAKLSIEEFLQPLDEMHSDQGKLIKSLKRMAQALN